MGIFKIRTAFINEKLAKTKDADLKRWLSNGFIPDQLQAEYEEYAKSWVTQEDLGSEPDTDIDKISNANWFAVHPDKVGGTIHPGSGFLNPVIVKGTLADVINSIDKTLSGSKKQDNMKKEPKYSEGSYVKYIQGDLEKETWIGKVIRIVDLDGEYAYRIDAYTKDMGSTVTSTSEKVNEKYEAMLRPATRKEFDDLEKRYKKERSEKSESKKYDIIFTNAGGVTVASNKLDTDKKTQDYRAIAHISSDGTVKYFVKDLPSSVVSDIETQALKDKVKKDFGAGSNIIFAKVAPSPNAGPEVEMSRPELGVILANNLLDEPKVDGPKTQTVAETIKKYNPGLSEKEIKAWVYHKRRFGNPMKGWEAYFMKGGTGFSTLLQTTKDTMIKDNAFEDLRVIPANTVLGVKTKFKNEYRDINYVICKTTQGEFVWVNTADVKEQKHQTSETVIELIELVKADALLFDGNDYYPYPVYLFGDIYSKMKQLNDNYQLIVDAFGQEQFDRQIAKVKEYLPKTKSFRDPVKSNRPNMLCLSEFANDPDQFGVLSLHEESGVKLGYVKRNRFEEHTEKISLFSAFNQWMEESVKDTDLKNTTRADIRKYYFAKSVSWPKDAFGNELLTSTQKNELTGNARLAAEELFGEFLANALTFDDSVVLDSLWNEKYNAFTSVAQFVDKIPIAFNSSTMFKDGELGVKPAQRQGLAYLQLTGSGTLAYDVGFGKTLTGILNIAQLISQGAIKRPLVVVPKPTYKNWLKELFGYWISEDGQKTDFKQFPGAIYHYGAFSGITEVKLNDWYNLSGKHYERLLKENGGDLNKLIPENTVTVVSYKGFEQMGFSRSISSEMFDSIARVIMQKDAQDERQQKSEKKEAKEKVSFYQKIQGWLGLGNKNAVVNVDVCGFDHISVDEAHNFKNVFPSCGKDPATGRKLFDISASQSTRAVKMFFITQYIQLKYGKNVVDLTATPFTNSPLEIYSMLSFVGLDTLNQYNLFNIKKFFEQFVLQTIEYAIDAKGEIITKPVIKSFQNLKLLQTILLNHFHYKADPKEAGVVRPCLINIPNKDISTYLEMNDWQRNNQVLVKEMAKSVSRKDPGAGLRAMSMSLDNAFSPYLFEKSVPESAEDFVNDSPKIKYTMECIKTIKEWHQKRGEECSGIIIYSNRGKEYFEYIKDYLTQHLGFKNNISYDDEVISEVEIITGGGGEADEDWKELVKDAFNAGVVKVIIGTGTIREGINLQKRCPTTFDLYPEWNPTDVWQLKGRNWRQGNIYGYVRFVMPLVINSMDNFINQKLDEKGKRIASIWAPIGDLNSLENTSDLDPSEIKYQLVDDVNERFKMRYETVKADLERQWKIANDNKLVIAGVADSVQILKDREESIFTDLYEKRLDWPKVVEYIKTLNLVEMKKDQDMRKTATDLERLLTNTSELIEKFAKYDASRLDIPALLEVMRILKQRSFEVFYNYSSEAQTIKRKMSEFINYYTFKIYERDYSNFVEAWADVRKAEKSVLNAYGKGFMDDINPIVKDIQKKINALLREKEMVESEEYKAALISKINEEMEAAKSVRGDLSEQVSRFSALNHTLSYLNDNTDKEGCPIPTEECCSTTGIHVVHQDKEIYMEPEFEVVEPVTESDLSEEEEIQEAIEFLTEMLPDLSKKDRKEAEEAIEFLSEMIMEEAAE